MNPANLILPRHLHIGGGVIKNLPRILGTLGVTNPIILTDSFMSSCGNVNKLINQSHEGFPGISYGVFDGCIEDPSTDSVHAAVEAVKKGSHDSIIALGGGSPIDTAKAASVLSVYNGHMREYKAPFSFDKPGLPVIAIPTTAGTGSEVTKFTVISDSETHEKMLCMGSAYVPSAALVDYELTVSMPPRLTADTAIDSLTHALEAFVSRKRNGFSNFLSLAAMSTIPEWVVDAFDDPLNLNAREALMMASCQAGMAFSNSSVCLVHALSRPLGARFKIPHGLSNAILLPRVTEFSIQGAMNLYAECSYAMGMCQPEDTTDQEACRKLVEGLGALNWRLNVPKLKELGISPTEYREAIPTMAEEAIASGSHLNNPRVPTIDEIEDLYETVFDDVLFGLSDHEKMM